MDHLSRIGVFTAVARHESFAAAARALGLTTAAVSKQVQNLEGALGVRLLNRTTRKVSLTEEGAIFYARATRALEDIREATDEINEMRATPRGPLKISVPMSFGVRHLTAPIAAFARQYPDVHMDVHFDDRMVDMSAEGFDVAIRIGALKDSSLVSRKLRDCPFVLCAAPDYIAQYGMPRVPDDIGRMPVLAYTRNTGAHEWRYRAPDGGEGAVALHSNFRCDTADMMIAAAQSGLGAILMPSIFVADELRAGTFVPLLPDYETTPQRSIWAVFPTGRFMSTRLRLFVDHIAGFCTALDAGAD